MKKRKVLRVYLNTPLLRELDVLNRDKQCIRKKPLARKETIPFKGISILWEVLEHGPYTEEEKFSFTKVIDPGLDQLIYDKQCLPLSVIRKCCDGLDYDSLRHYMYRGWPKEIEYLYMVATAFNVTLEELVPGFDAKSVKDFYWKNLEWAGKQSLKDKDSKSPRAQEYIERINKLFPTIPERDLL